ncbi:MAG TPA: tRNA lysidine(34) synthetase TilS [Chloroflexota bacterium]|nr:tRNA lysidine(34) synthetase TilS [Chloroflexota bacterium]
MASRITTPTNPVAYKLPEALKANDLLGRRVVAAVSGGADSLALLFGLSELQRSSAIDVYVAHFDHGLRSDSADDARFVERVAGDLNLPVRVGTAAVAEIARRERRGIEETARRERYRFLGEVAQAVGAVAVVTGHTADDQTETRLLHLVRGAGLHGLAGMETVVTLAWPDVAPIRVVRPLLQVSRLDTEAFCAARGVTPRQDPSNSDCTFARNRLRHEAVPVLTSLNPRFSASLNRLARVARDADEFVESELTQRLPTLVDESSGSWLVERSAWRALPNALKRALLRRAASAVAPYADPLDAGHIEEAMDAADVAPAGTTLSWPSGRILRISHDHFRITNLAGDLPELTEQAVSLSGDVPVAIDINSVALAVLPRSSAGGGPEHRVTLTLHHKDRRCHADSLDRWHVDFDLDRLVEADPLVLRARRPGERLAPAGIEGTKKLQDILIDAHVPREERGRVPILAGTGGPIWVVGLRPDRRYLASPDCRRVLCATVEINPVAQSSSAKELARWGT